MKLSIQSLETCLDPTIAGRKGAGLARLLQAGFAVPPGCCVTTEAYLHACARVGLDLRHDWESIRSLPADQRRTVLSAARAGLLAFPWPAEWSADLEEAIGKVRPVPISFWAVRSSATDEDAADASAAGLYRTQLGIRSADLAQAILHCWASTWEERVFDYWVAKGTSRPEPAMAVVLQPMVEARVSGVAFSRHPIAGRGDEILINAVPGLAEPLVSGRVTPDEYVVTLNSSGGSGSVSRRHLSRKAFMMSLTADGLMLKRLAKQDGHRESLTDNEAIQLAAAVRKAEQALGFPVDVEWAFDQQHLWFLQARPIPIRQGGERPTDEQCDWSRANFKETLPELPSPLGLSFLEVFMEDFILRHYRELGCVVPDGWSAVRIVEGRPFINVTLVQSFQVQLGGHPELVTEHMGGSSRMPPAEPGRLSFWRLARAYFVMHRKIRRALREAPAWFGELKRTGLEQIDGALHTLSSQELVRRVEWLGDRLRQGECTFAIVAAVGQAQQILGLLLPRWLGSDWRALLDAALQGQETIVSARQVQWLRQIGERARHDARAIAFFQSEPWKPASYRERLAGTDCLVELEKFLTEYGHRAIGESDLMVPRFAEDPSYLLEVIRRHVADASGPTADQTGARQRRERKALIRRRCGWRYDRWLIFRWWYRRLCRACELRESNRHHLMYYATATRRLALALGRQLAAGGRLSDPEDVFFVTAEELRTLASDPRARDWKALVAERRASRRRHAATTVPDFIPAKDSRHMRDENSLSVDGIFHGIPIGAGIVEGRVTLVRGMEDIGKVRQGDIIVTEVIDPGMASVFGLAGGLIADMGGTLSHGAIIVREYGIPAIVNVAHATSRLRDGERVKLNATEGTAHRTSA